MPSVGSTIVSDGRRTAIAFDGEVPPAQVAVEGVAEDDLGLARRGHVGVLPVGRDLDGVAGDARRRRCRTRGPTSHIAEASGFSDPRPTPPGRAEVVRSRSVTAPVEQRVAHGPADQRDLVARRLEGRDDAGASPARAASAASRGKAAATGCMRPA